MQRDARLAVAQGAALDLADPRSWLPMRPYRGRRTFEIADPILEPFWSGVRVIAHVASRSADPLDHEVEIFEELGADVASDLPGLRDALAGSVTAFDAVIDGVISRQVAIGGVGAANVPEMRGRPGLLLGSDVDLEVVPRGASAEEGEAPDGLIALDLLRVDGTPLLDVPLLERKRLLESAVSPGELVRTSVYVRPPIDTWLSTWKSLGLRGGILKASNSRYLPGQDTIEWRIVERVGGRS
jgi:ATP-dependent DNA ligase